MADLEEMGLVYQPHTSAGRLPTDLGIRLFVDVLMEHQRLSELERTMISSWWQRISASEDPWHQMVRMLSDLSQQPAVLRSPGREGMVLRQLRFVPLASGETLAVLVGVSGVTQTRRLTVGEELPPEELERIHNYLNEFIPGRTLAEARRVIEREAEENRRCLDGLKACALRWGRDALAEVSPPPVVAVHGQAKLVQNGNWPDPERLRELMELLDDQDRLARLLDATLEATGPHVVIGSEHPLTGHAGCSVITAVYHRGPGLPGALGVIGPRSMDYGRVMSLVEYSARFLSDIERN
jgi:heat-inducible transcriptional repressor